MKSTNKPTNTWTLVHQETAMDPSPAADPYPTHAAQLAGEATPTAPVATFTATTTRALQLPSGCLVRTTTGRCVSAVIQDRGVVQRGAVVCETMVFVPGVTVDQLAGGQLESLELDAAMDAADQRAEDSGTELTIDNAPDAWELHKLDPDGGEPKTLEGIHAAIRAEFKARLLAELADDPCIDKVREILDRDGGEPDAAESWQDVGNHVNGVAAASGPGEIPRLKLDPPRVQQLDRQAARNQQIQDSAVRACEQERERGAE